MTSTVLRVLLAAAYPFLILGSLQILAARWVAAVLGVLFLARWAIAWNGAVGERLRELWIPAALVGSVILSTGLSNDERMLLLAPAAVNLALLAGFGRTLWAGPPLVETLARLQVPDLPDDEIRYCRSVTLVWCGFFALNASISAWLAFAATRQTWAIYTGFLAYLLVGLLFACEFVVRSWRFGRYQGTIVEPLFRRIFPPPRGGTAS
jgi:uncharacterized membrane protein